MKLPFLKNARITNIILAILATVSIGWMKKDFGIANLIICFSIVYLLLMFIDLIDKWMTRKINKKVLTRAEMKKNS